MQVVRVIDKHLKLLPTYSSQRTIDMQRTALSSHSRSCMIKPGIYNARKGDSELFYLLMPLHRGTHTWMYIHLGHLDTHTHTGDQKDMDDQTMVSLLVTLYVCVHNVNMITFPPQGGAVVVQQHFSYQQLCMYWDHNTITRCPYQLRNYPSTVQTLRSSFHSVVS